MHEEHGGMIFVRVCAHAGEVLRAVGGTFNAMEKLCYTFTFFSCPFEGLSVSQRFWA